MRIRSFTVQGFANFSQPLSLGPLEDVNVICGGNEVGKSNLLRALELYFYLLGLGDEVSAAFQRPLNSDDPHLEALLAGGFNRTQPHAITFYVDWNISREALNAAGLRSTIPAERVSTVLDVSPAAPGQSAPPQLRILKWGIGDQDAATTEAAQNSPLQAFARDLRQVLAGARAVPASGRFMAFRWAGRESELFPQAVRDALFDARHSMDPADRRRWSLFAELMASAAQELGPGGWDVAFDRASGSADLVYLKGETPLPVDRMGAGLRRLAGLIGELCLIREPWVAIEEPEIHLSLAFQQRLVQLARRVLESGVGPRQLLMTTHSPHLAGLCTPFVLRMDNGIPVPERRLWGVAPGRQVRAPGAPAEGPATELDQLIGLVSDLEKLEPEVIIEQAPPAP